MARLKITNLAMPPRRFRPDLESDAPRVVVEFETKEAATREDGKRLQSLKRLLKRPHRLEAPFSEEDLKRLIKRISKAASPASNLHMRKQRVRIGGHLWSLVSAEPGAVSTFTLIPRTWEFAGGRLDHADPRALLAQLRQTLIRCGSQEAEGWLIAAIHGEHEPNDDVFRLHVHGIAQGGMRNVIDRLRTRMNFRSIRKGPQAEKVHQRVRMTRTRLSNLPDPLTYIVQSFWPERAIYKTPSGDVERQTRKRRIEEPRHTEVLQWLDRWSLNYTVLLMGIHVGRSGFRVTKKRTRKNL